MATKRNLEDPSVNAPRKMASTEALNSNGESYKTPTTLKAFESVFPQLVQDISDHARQYNIPQNALEWFQTVR